MAIAGLGQALGIIGQGIQQKAQLDWQEQRQANLERIRAEELEAARTERKGEFEANKKLQQAQIDNTKDYHDKSLGIQAENMREDNKARKAQLGISQKMLANQEEATRFGRESDLMEQALKPYKDINDSIKAVSASQPTYTAEGAIKGFASEKEFYDAKGRQLEALTKSLSEIKPKVQESVRKAYSRVSPDTQKWFDGLVGSLDAPASNVNVNTAEEERRAFLRSPEEVAKRKAAQAAVDGGAPQPLLNRPTSGPASEDPKWIARQEEIKRLDEARAAKAAEEKRIQDEENYRILEGRRLGRVSDAPSKPFFSSNGFDRRY